MSLPEATAAPRAQDFIASLGDGRTLSDPDLQALLAAAVRIYAERAEGRDELPAFPVNNNITATHAMVAVTAMLKAVNVQVFELGMWQAWSGR